MVRFWMVRKMLQFSILALLCVVLSNCAKPEEQTAFVFNDDFVELPRAGAGMIEMHGGDGQ